MAEEERGTEFDWVVPHLSAILALEDVIRRRDVDEGPGLFPSLSGSG